MDINKEYTSKPLGLFKIVMQLYSKPYRQDANVISGCHTHLLLSSIQDEQKNREWINMILLGWGMHPKYRQFYPKMHY